LAEEIRAFGVMALIGRTPRSFHVPAHAEDSDPRREWMSWHFRAIVRELGLPNVSLNSAYLEQWCDYAADLIADQVKFHQFTAERNNKIHHRLHQWSYVAFFLTLVACLAHLLIHFVETAAGSSVSTWLTVAAVIFPAIGASFAGILAQGEFERVAQRSKNMRKALAKALVDFQHSDLSAEELGERSGAAVDMMVTELLDWRILFVTKRVSVPN
jgi:hypothetical protein